MDILNQRLFFSMSNKRLRRARRLYVAINLKQLEKYKTIALNKMVKKAVNAGLYSENTGIRDIKFSIMRHHYNLTKDRDGCTDWLWSWHDWLEKHNVSMRSACYKDKAKLSIPAVIN